MTPPSLPRLTLLLSTVMLLAACKTLAPGSGTGHTEVREIDDLARIAPALAEGGKRRNLLVLDIDDTLLTSAGFFGSDKWYEWQKTLTKDDPGKVPCLFDVIALNYEAGAQVPTQPDGPTLLGTLAVDTLLLSSRNPLYRGGTARTLREAGYALPASLDGLTEGRSWGFRANPASAAVTVEYEQGVFLTSGQDKGKVLLDLLQRIDRQYDRVILVDDGKRNIDNMQAALREAGIDYLGLHYTRIAKTVSEADAQAGREGWQAWRGLLEKLYPQRLQAFEAGQCAY